MSPVRSRICFDRGTGVTKNGRDGGLAVVGRPELPIDQWNEGSRDTRHGNLHR